MTRTGRDADGTEQEPRNGERPAYFVQSLERGLKIIKAFDETRPQMTSTEVSKATGLDRAATRRFLLTLVDLGYMVTDGRLYALRPRILELGYAYLSSLSLPDVALPHMEQLVTEIHESCSLGVLDGDEVVFVARVPTKRLMSVPIMVGSRFPAYPTSMGRVLLAGQSEERLDAYLSSVRLESHTRRTVTDPAKLRSLITRVRTQGWAIVDQEYDEGTRSVAMPVRDSTGRVVAAINVSMLSGRGTAQSMRDFLPVIERAVAQIEADLRPGFRGQEMGLLG